MCLLRQIDTEHNIQVQFENIIGTQIEALTAKTEIVCLTRIQI